MSSIPTTTVRLREFGGLLDQIIEHNHRCGLRKAKATEYIVPCLISDPGQGKTSLFEQAAKRRGVDCHIVVPVAMEPTDAMGLPMPMQTPDGEFITKWAKPELIFRAAEDAIVLIDEATKAPPMLMNVFSQLLEERRINHHKLGLFNTVALAGNHLSNRAGDQELPSHVSQRMMHFNIVNPPEDILEHAAEVGLATEVTGYIAWKRAKAFSFDPNSRTNPTPRSWFKVAHHVHSEVMKDVPMSLQRAMVVGYVGEGPAADYMAFLKVRAGIPHPDKIIADPHGAMVPKADQPDMMWAIVSALSGHANVKNVEKIMIYLDRFKAKEFTVFAIKDMMGRVPAINAVPGVLKWKMNNRHLFTPVL